MRSILIYVCVRRVEEEDEPAAGPANKRQKQGNQGPRSNYSQGQILVLLSDRCGRGMTHMRGGVRQLKNLLCYSNLFDAMTIR